MNPKQIFITLLLCIAILTAIMIFIFIINLFNKNQRKNNKLKPSLDPELLKNPAKMFENLILMEGKVNELDYNPNFRINELIKELQKSSDFELLSLINSYMHFNEEKTLDKLERLCQSLLRLQRSTDLDPYYYFYSNLLAFMRRYENGDCDWNEILTIQDKPYFNTIQSLSIHQRNLRKLITQINATFLEIYKIFKFINKLSSDNFKKDDYSELQKFKSNILDLIQLLKKSSVGLLETEFNIYKDVLNHQLEIIEEQLNKYSPEIPRKENILISIEPNEIQVIKGEEISIDFEIINQESFFCDGVFLHINSNPESKIEIDKKGKVNIGQLLPKQSKEFQFKILSHSNEVEITLDVELGYRNKAGKEISKPIPIKISFEDPETVLNKSPYQITPLVAPIRYFVGRKQIIEKISKIINSGDSGKLIGLFGLSRIGKTALIFEIIKEEKIESSIIPIYYCMDEHSFSSQNWFDSLLSSLNEKIQKTIKDSGLHMPINFNTRQHLPNIIIEFLNKIQDELERNKKYILLIIDEYQRIEENTTPAFDIYKKDVIRLFKQIAIHIPRVTLLLSGYHDIYTLSRYDSFWSETLGKGFESFKLTFLKKDESLKLINEPMSRFGISYADDVAEKIYDWTRGYPWFTQIICYDLLDKSLFNKDKIISMDHLNYVIDQILTNDSRDEIFQQLLSGKWAGVFTEAIVQIISKAPENIVINEDNMNYVPRRYILNQFNKFGLKIEMGTLITRMESLTRKDILLTKEFNEDTYSAISIPLYKKWNLIKADIEATISKISSHNIF